MIGHWLDGLTLAFDNPPRGPKHTPWKPKSVLLDVEQLERRWMPTAVSFSSSSYTIGETAGKVTITVQTSDTPSGTITVDYATSNGSATAGTDYTAKNGTLTFNAMTTSDTFDVYITDDDATGESNETITLTLSNVQGGTLGTSSATITITNTTPTQWADNGFQRQTDPMQGYWYAFGPAWMSPQTGDLMLSQDFDYRKSLPAAYDAWSSAAGMPALVYHSTTADARPVIEVTLGRDISASISNIAVRLTWDNGSPQSWVNYAAPGSGLTMTFANQVSSAVTSSGRYPWQIEMVVTFANRGDVTRTVTGTADVAVLGSGTAAGYGWGIGGLDKLVADGSSGMLWVYGDGGTRYFTGSGGTYTSPANDFGTLVKNVDNTYTYTAHNQVKWNFDTSGNLASIVDPHNLARTFTYSGGNLATVAEPDGGVTTFTYGSGKLTSIALPGNRTMTVTVDGSTNLTNLALPDGSLRTFTYDGSHHLTNAQHGLSNTTFTYDGTSGLLSSIDRGASNTLNLIPAAAQSLTTAQDSTKIIGKLTDALNNIGTITLDTVGRLEGRITVPQPVGYTDETWTRNAAGQVTSFTDNLSRITTYTYDVNHDLTQIDHPDGSSEDFVYDGTFHTVTRHEDTLNHVTTFTYHATYGDLTSVRNALNEVTTYTWSSGLLQSITNPLNKTTTFLYDAARRLETVLDALNQRTTLGYDAAGNIGWMRDNLNRLTNFTSDGMRRLLTVSDPEGGVMTLTYNAQGQVLTHTDQNSRTASYTYDARNWLTSRMDAVGTAVQRSYSYGYDAWGRLTSITDPLNHTTTLTYDAKSRLTSVKDALSNITTFTYDAAGQNTAIIDPLNHTTTFTYNSRGWRTQIEDALNNLTTVGYDTEGNLTSVKNARGYTTTYVYDVVDRLIQVTDALNNKTTIVYDAVGNVEAAVDALTNRTTFTYDAINRLITQKDALNHTTTYAYDAVDNLTSITDPLNHTMTFVYDGLNRVTQQFDALAGKTTFVYDGVDNLLNLIDPVGNKTTFLYDALHRMTDDIDPLGNRVTYAYDAADRLTSTTDRLTRRQDFTYDNADRLTGVVWKNSGGTTVNTVTYTYDNASNFLTAGDQNGFYTFTYDNVDRVATQKDLWNLSLTFTYDGVHNRTKVEDSLSGVTTSVYNAVDLLESRRFGGAGQTPLRIDFTYTARHELETIRRYSDLNGNTLVGSTTYVYDAVSNLTNLQHRNNGGTLLGNYTFTCDAADRLTTEVFNGTTVTYTYDITDQLTADGINTFTYDANGNRTGGGYTVGTGNRLTNDGVWTYTYDNAGNLTKKSKGASLETWEYGYNHNNQMLWAEKRQTDGGTLQMRADYKYDVFGNRIEKAVDADGAGGGGTTTTRFAYDGIEIWADLNGSSALQTRYLKGDVVDQLFARISSGGTAAWYYTDRLGSVRQMVDASGVAQNTIAYDGWGSVVNETNGSFGDRWKWTGRELDSETELQYNRWRYYGPGMGRWTTRDPISFAAGDMNLFRYSGNAPVLVTDPSGLDWSLQGAIDGAWNGHCIGTWLLPGGGIFGAIVGGIEGARRGPLPREKNPSKGGTIGIGASAEIHLFVLHFSVSIDIHVGFSPSHGVTIGGGPTGGVHLGPGLGVSGGPQVTVSDAPTVADLDGESKGGQHGNPYFGTGVWEAGPKNRTGVVTITGPGPIITLVAIGSNHSKIWSFP